MFENDPAPRVFGVPPGVDFAQALIDGIDRRLAGQPPLARARVEIFVNTRRMQRRLHEIHDHRPAALLPRIRLIPDLGANLAFPGLPPPKPRLERQLELAQLVAGLVERMPDLAPRGSIHDLARSLADLIDEMNGEGVGAEAIAALDVGRHSAHWQRVHAFVALAAEHFGPGSGEQPDPQGRLRLAVEHLAARWKTQPPDHPVIVAGSTGSRGATALLMQAVARLPQGALVLPGFDFEMPAEIWERLDDPRDGEDHPQFRFARLLDDLEVGAGSVSPWGPEAPPSRARNRLVSLALRPAPVTDQWITEGPALGDEALTEACAGLTLIEAPSPREEAAAIALALHEAAEAGLTAALITPDRMLTRQVASALDRWRITPDDSAGEPVALTAPGRLLMQVAELAGEPLTGHGLIALLKHPLCHSGGGRGDHLRFTRDLELELLRGGPAFPSEQDITAWATNRRDDTRAHWAAWVAETLCNSAQTARAPLARLCSEHLELAEALARGSQAHAGSGALWEQAAGEAARATMDELQRAAPHGGTMDHAEYRDLLRTLMQGAEARNPLEAHPRIRIWGTLEARVQGAELVVLGSLNEGAWPEPPAADPWLNRQMRLEAGLLLPERRIGLAAHDFQQAIAGARVIVSRALRDAESETVPSRWLNRLTNLLGGLGPTGQRLLDDMRARGRGWLDRAAALDELPPEARTPALQPAGRPAPCPPVAVRPRSLSVTRITRLVRDPYAIYAQKILHLTPLDPLAQTPDARLKGTILHRALEQFIAERPGETPDEARARLVALVRQELEQSAPWPAARALWLARIARIAQRFVTEEAERSADARNLANEVKGRLDIAQVSFTLTATADRIDQLSDGRLAIYDYKSGAGPSKRDQEYIDKQLPLEALIAEAGEFEGVPRAQVARVGYIGLGLNAKYQPIAAEDLGLDHLLTELSALVAAYERPEQGYAAMRIPQAFLGKISSDYAHLARFGEWQLSDRATPEEVGR